MFLVTRNLADGLRLFLSALALNIAIGLDVLTCIIVMTIITAIYSCAGGVRSVVWNDCIQFAVYMARRDCDRVGHRHASAGRLGAARANSGSDTHRWQLFDFDPSLTKPTVTFWSGLFGGAFLTLATHGVGPNDRAALSVRTNQTIGELGTRAERFHRARPVCIVSDDRRGTGVFLFGERGRNRPDEGRQGVDDVRRSSHGYRVQGVDFGGGAGGDDVELVEFVQFVGQFVDERLAQHAGCRRWTIDSRLRMARLLTLISAAIHAGVADCGLQKWTRRIDVVDSCWQSPAFRPACCSGFTCWA